MLPRDIQINLFSSGEKNLEPVSLPFQITIIYQGKTHKRKRKRNRNSWRKEKNNSSIVHNISRTNTKRIGIPRKMCYHWLLLSPLWHTGGKKIKDQSWNLHGCKSTSFFFDWKSYDNLEQLLFGPYCFLGFFSGLIFVNHSNDHGTEDGLTIRAVNPMGHDGCFEFWKSFECLIQCYLNN